MLKVLAIGNSFSEDATYYLHDIAEAEGKEIQVVNLYIGGCSLEQHWRCIETHAHAYQYQVNGNPTARYVSIQEALASEKWDIIVTQQCSHDSGWENTYEPFVGLLVDFLKLKAPQANILLQKTWAYEADSSHEHFMRYNRNPAEMFDRLSQCYAAISQKYQLGLIPCGDIIEKLRKLPEFTPTKEGVSIYRDGFHMHYIYGRYALAYTWARYLLGRKLENNTYLPYSEYLPEERADVNLIKLIRTTIETIWK